MAHSPANLQAPSTADEAASAAGTAGAARAQSARLTAGAVPGAGGAAAGASGGGTSSPTSTGGPSGPVPAYGARPARAAHTRALLYRWWAWAVRWLRDYFAPERLLAFLKALLWVTPLTILIWVYAERQQQFTEPGQTVPIEVMSGDPNRIALIQRPADGNVVVSLKGPKANIDRLKELLRTPGVAPIQIQAERTGRDGEQTLTIPTSRIGQDKRFVDAGVTIENPQPESLIVRIEPMVDWDVPIQVPPQQREQFSNVVFDPPTVRVRGPASVVGDRNDGRDLSPRVFVYADLSNRPELQALPEQDKKVLRDVKVGLAVRNPNVTMTPPPAGVTAEVRPSGTEEYTILSLPVKLVPGPAARDFEWPESITPLFNVVVTGPKEKIEKLHGPTAVLPAAFAELPANAVEGPNDATVSYRFDPGITVKSGPASVKVQLTPKTR